MKPTAYFTRDPIAIKLPKLLLTRISAEYRDCLKANPVFEEPPGFGSDTANRLFTQDSVVAGTSASFDTPLR